MLELQQQQQDKQFVELIAKVNNVSRRHEDLKMNMFKVKQEIPTSSRIRKPIDQIHKSSISVDNSIEVSKNSLLKHFEQDLTSRQDILKV